MVEIVGIKFIRLCFTVSQASNIYSRLVVGHRPIQLTDNGYALLVI